MQASKFMGKRFSSSGLEGINQDNVFSTFKQDQVQDLVESPFCAFYYNKNS